MPQSLSKLYIHIVFSTKKREKSILPNIEEALYKYINGTLKNLKSPLLAVNSVSDHIHILCVQNKNITTAELVESIKTSSSKYLKTLDGRLINFSWQIGYASFSVSPSKFEDVKQYITNQKEHHNREGFKEELIRFLRKYQINFNEKYLWD